jgi:hypothetical protein
VDLKRSLGIRGRKEKKNTKLKTKQQEINKERLLLSTASSGE